jgi:hypothetical protein
MFQSQTKVVSILSFIRKHWYIVILLIFIIPPVIHSITIAINTSNPTYPIFDLATRLFASDSKIKNIVNLLETDPSALIGMEKPISGIWNNFLYSWKFFWSVIWEILGNIWTIFFPFFIIYKIGKLVNSSQPLKNVFMSLIWFLVFMLITNVIILIYNQSIGNLQINIPEGTDKFGGYLYIFEQILPFHGVGSLVGYLIQKITS